MDGCKIYRKLCVISVLVLVLYLNFVTGNDTAQLILFLFYAYFRLRYRSTFAWISASFPFCSVHDVTVGHTNMRHISLHHACASSYVQRQQTTILHTSAKIFFIKALNTLSKIFYDTFIGRPKCCLKCPPSASTQAGYWRQHWSMALFTD